MGHVIARKNAAREAVQVLELAQEATVFVVHVSDFEFEFSRQKMLPKAPSVLQFQLVAGRLRRKIALI